MTSPHGEDDAADLPPGQEERGPTEDFGGDEPDTPARRVGWLARIFLILLAMAMVPWLLEQCQDPDGRLPAREEAPAAR